MTDAFTLSLPVGLGLGHLAAVAGGLTLYLTSPNQALLRAPLGRRFRMLAWSLMATALAAFLACLGAPAAVAAWGVALMLTFLAVPFLALCKRPQP